MPFVFCDLFGLDHFVLINGTIVNGQKVGEDVDDAEHDKLTKPNIKILQINDRPEELTSEAFCNIMCGLHNLQTIFMKDVCNVGQEGYACLFRDAPKLECVSVCRGTFTDETAAIMTMYCRKLSKVYIQDNHNITDRALESFVAFGMPLEELSLSDCSGVSFKSIELVVKKCKTLRMLKYTGFTGIIPPRTLNRIAKSSVTQLFVRKASVHKWDIALLPKGSNMRLMFCD